MLWLGHFSSRIWEDDQSPNTLRNFSLYKIRFLKVPGRSPKNQGGGVKAKLKEKKQKQIFLLDGFPKCPQFAVLVQTCGLAGVLALALPQAGHPVTLVPGQLK